MNVTRYETAEAFLQVAQPLLMTAEAENNLLLGVAQGIARNPAAAKNPYLATVGNETGVLACAVHIAPFKLVITRANREPIAALARDVFEAVPQLDGVTGPSRSADDFSLAWSKLSGVEPVLAMRLRIHETRKVVDSDLPSAPGHFRPAAPADLNLLAKWTEVFVSEARIAEPVDASRVVEDAITTRPSACVGRRQDRCRWRHGRGRRRAACASTSCTRRANCAARATARPASRRSRSSNCEQGNAFCWLYTDVSSAASPKIFKRIGYWPVSDVSEYYLK